MLQKMVHIFTTELQKVLTKFSYPSLCRTTSNRSGNL